MNKRFSFFLLLSTLACSVVQAQIVVFPGNGHAYEYVPFDPFELSWEEARDAASQREFLGFSGHLATITSAEESQFVIDQFELVGPTGVLAGLTFIGGQEPNGDGVWIWAVGPEAGIQFSQEGVATEPFNYTNWADGEPNNFGGLDEDFLAMVLVDPPAGSAGADLGEWNDTLTTSQFPTGYLVEYSIEEAQPVPVNSLGWLLLLAMSILMLGLVRASPARL